MTPRLMLLMLAYAPLQAIAQQTQMPITPPAYYGSGPWHMWAYGSAWNFWLMLPMMIFFFVVICAAMSMVARSAFGHGGPFLAALRSAISSIISILGIPPRHKHP
jgi:hypothetical protein